MRISDWSSDVCSSDLITAVTRKLAGRELQPAGELRVTTNDSLLVHLLTPHFAGFRRQCPDVRLDIVLSNQPLNLSKRDADVAIRATDAPPDNLVGRRIARIAWGLSAAQDTAETIDQHGKAPCRERECTD